MVASLRVAEKLNIWVKPHQKYDKEKENREKKL